MRNVLQQSTVFCLMLAAASGASLADDPQAHWAYRPVVRSSTPAPRDDVWPHSSIDHFLLHRLEEAGIEPVSPADRGVLYRRLTFDLWGLPPEPADLGEFVDDFSPDALERAVDRLLADPRFGQRWGRHWLDVVRYAESLTLRGFVFPEAWRYRDYVIESFNSDRPFDLFVRQQIAGDLLPADSLEERRNALIATTVLMLGNTNLEEQDKQQLEMDLIDDQLDLIGRGILGQTLSCARCHDHKFDPISTEDYYALAGILKGAKGLAHENVSKWLEVPLPLESDQEAIHSQAEREIANVKARLAEAKAALAKASGKSGLAKAIALATLPGIVVDDAQARKVGEWKHSTSVEPYVGEGYLHDIDSGKGDKSLTFQPEIKTAGQYEVRLAYTPGGNRSSQSPITIFSADGEQILKVDQKKAPPINRVWISLGKFRFEANGAGFVMVGNADTEGHVVVDAVQFLPVDSGDAPPNATEQPAADDVTPEAARAIERLQVEVRQLEVELKRLQTKAPVRPKVMSIVEQPDPRDLLVHLRGSVHSLGPAAPRGFPRFGLAASAPPNAEFPIPAGQSGRRQFADWLTSRGNPLVARVYVNRVWHWLMGRGLVGSTDNFGVTGDLPTHPELLDHLAQTFVDDGWSTKRLIRRIVLSQSYQLSDADSEHARIVDPDNRLVWRHNRRRLDAEELRDAMLLAGGDLSWEAGGPGFGRELESDYGFATASTRRSVYLPVFRNAILELFEAFDFADPSSVTGVRARSTVAPQALTLMNLPFVIAQSQAFARRMAREGVVEPDRQIDRIYRQLIGRSPTEGERQLCANYLTETAQDSDSERMASLIQSLMATIEFRYVR